MNIIVQKYGGTSVGTAEKIMNVARRIIRTKKAGNAVVVVISAMGGTTDQLVDLAKSITDYPPKREMDMLLSTGEQVSISLLAMAIQKLGVPAISFTGTQVGILTDSEHTSARILSISTKKMKEYLKKNHVVIVAGFQGMDKDYNITTLGRGGSDTSAVALAAVLKGTCEIYTDVDGIFTADPRIVNNAKILDKISHDEILEMASMGAKVLHLRAVEFAKKYNVKLVVRSSLNNKKGTKISREDNVMEETVITGVTHKDTDIKMSVLNIPDSPGVASKIFGALADKNINVDMIIQSIGHDKKSDISFTINKDNQKDAVEALNPVVKKMKGKGISVDKEIGIVSIVGVGMKSHPGVASKMFDILAKNKINIDSISTSEIKVSCIIDKKNLKKAVKEIHKGFFK